MGGVFVGMTGKGAHRMAASQQFGENPAANETGAADQCYVHGLPPGVGKEVTLRTGDCARKSPIWQFTV